jgi:acetylornithine deacetylase
MVEGELSEIIHRVQQSDLVFKAVVRRGLDRSPLETLENAGIVGTVQAAAAKVLGRPLPIAGVPFWTDAALLSEAGIPSILFGPAGSGAHADEEWVDLASVKTCADIYLASASEFCS